MPKVFLLIVFLIPVSLFGQVVIRGRVISQADTKPVANASVFISNTTIGYHTGSDGTFVLKDIKQGKYELVISLVGFDTWKQNITVGPTEINLGDVTVYPKSIGLAEVKIKAKKGKDPDRERNLEWFREEFLGTNELARSCVMLNPEQLDLNYDEKSGILTGSSNDFLIIENKTLGYRLKYLLSSFVLNNYDNQNKSFSYAGTILFEPMRGTMDEEKEWKAARRRVYEGSQLHFLRAVLTNRMKEEGFEVLRVASTFNPKRQPDSVINENIKAYTLLVNNDSGKDRKKDKDSLNYWVKQSQLPLYARQKLMPTPLLQTEIVKDCKAGLHVLNSGGDALFIIYDKYGHFSTGAYSHLSEKNNNSTLVTFVQKEALFDNNGTIINPQSVSYEGVWSRNRVAMQLPVDNEPEQSATTATDTVTEKKVTAKVADYIAKYQEEKVYLHFDKPLYAAGDTIYFKAYLTEGEAHKLSQQSGVLYADLIDGKNKISQSIRMQVKDGITWGDFALADSLKDDNYRVRAYTRLIEKDSTGILFDQALPIVSLIKPVAPESSTLSSKRQSAKAALQFMPEGGTLVVGVKSKIAFKAEANNGRGIAVTGVVLDNTEKEVARFESSRLGMGSFYFIPELDKTYHAKLSYANGEAGTMAIPAASAKGISLSITSQPGNYLVKLSANKAWYQEYKNNTYTLITYSAGNPYGISCKLDNPEMTLTLPKSVLHDGIARITLFTAAGEPLCERLVFVHNDDKKDIAITGDKKSSHVRGKVTLNLNAPAQGYYSVSVTDESKVPVDSLNESTIINNLLFTSELKGTIEQPNYYFTNVSDKTRADLDLVMLTHGYRSFVWRDVLSENKGTNKVTLSQPEKGLTISGYVKANKKPVELARVKLFSKGGNALMLDTIADIKGHFVFDRLSFGDTAKFVLQARTEKGGKDVDIILDKPYELPVEDKLNGITDIETTTSNLAVYQKNADAFAKEKKKYGVNQRMQMLKEVVVKEKKKNIRLEHSENLNGKGNADQVITADWLENSGFINLYDAIRAKSMFLEFFISKEGLHQVRSKRTPSIAGPPLLMEIIIDGLPMQQTYPELRPGEPNPLEALDASDVESVEIGVGAHYGAIYGSRGAGGVIIVTTKRAKKINNYYRDAPGVVTYMPKGFYKAREFYAPQYDNPKTNQKIPDLRSTIYWNPNVITDKDGKASFSYFNADGKGTYRVIIEGIDADGSIGRAVYHYQVE